MATVIRLKRGGRTHEPYYRVVVLDSRRRNTGLEVDTLGVYHPCAKPEPLSRIDALKALEWLRKGAQPSDTAKNILRKVGVMKHFHDGTTPEGEATVVEHKAGVVENKGYNPPPPPKPIEPEAPAEEPVAEVPAEEAAAEAPADAAAAEAAPEAETTAE